MQRQMDKKFDVDFLLSESEERIKREILKLYSPIVQDTQDNVGFPGIGRGQFRHQFPRIRAMFVTIDVWLVRIVVHETRFHLTYVLVWPDLVDFSLMAQNKKESFWARELCWRMFCACIFSPDFQTHSGRLGRDN